jgi:hypothetical protein
MELNRHQPHPFEQATSKPLEVIQGVLGFPIFHSFGIAQEL